MLSENRDVGGGRFGGGCLLALIHRQLSRQTIAPDVDGRLAKRPSLDLNHVAKLELRYDSKS